MSEYVFIDCNRIQEYIFASNRLREICNGSKLLEEVESVNIPAKAKALGGTCIRSCGGVVIAEFNDGCNAQKFERQAKSCYREIGISTTSVIMNIATNSHDFYSTALNPLFTEMQKKKSRSSGSSVEVSTILSVPCEGSGNNVAEYVVTLPDGKKRRYSPADARKSRRNRDEAGSKCANFSSYSAPQDFGDLVSWGERSTLEDTSSGTSEGRLMGVIYADVNGLGGLTKDIGKDKEVYADFSERLGNIIQTALCDVLDEVITPELSSYSYKCLPFDILYMGGDDVAVAIHGRYALEVARQFLMKVEEKTQGLMEEVKTFNTLHDNFPDRLTMSAGVVIAPYNYPISHINRIGRELEIRAKAAGRYDNPVVKPSLIDFCLIKNNTSGSLADVRRFKFVQDTTPLLLYGGPYDPVGVGNVLKAACLLNNDEDRGIPKAKLRELLSVLWLPTGKRDLEYEAWNNRLSSNQQKTLQEVLSLLGASANLPIQTDRQNSYDIAPIVDVVEIMGIVR